MWYFTPNERRGLIIWAVCLTVICLSPYWVPETDDNQIISTIIENHSVSIDSIESFAENDNEKQKESYDPNTISAADLQKRGLPKFVAERWVKFRSIKGGFENINDVLSIYGIDSIWVEKQKLVWDTLEGPNQINPNIAISTQESKRSHHKMTERPASKTSGNTINLNTAGAQDFKAFGFKEGLAHRIVAYRKKAGPFYHYRDLYEIYEMDSQLVQRFLPKIQIESDKLPMLEINTANKEEWEKLPGIGPVYAGRIIKFREALGGFVNKNQLQEVYGLPEETWLRINPRINLQSLEIQKIKVNDADIEDFARHPYIDWTLAKRIYRYKEQHYPISTLDNMHGLDPGKIKDILPYFDFSVEPKTPSDWAQLNPSDSI